MRVWIAYVVAALVKGGDSLHFEAVGLRLRALRQTNPSPAQPLSLVPKLRKPMPQKSFKRVDLG